MSLQTLLLGFPLLKERNVEIVYEIPLVIRNVTKVLSNTVKQGYTREYRVPVYHKHPQLSYFSLERKNKEKKTVV